MPIFFFVPEQVCSNLAFLWLLLYSCVINLWSEALRLFSNQTPPQNMETVLRSICDQNICTACSLISLRLKPYTLSCLLTLKAVFVPVSTSIRFLPGAGGDVSSEPWLCVGRGSCPPSWKMFPAYSILYTTISFLVPLILMFTWNSYIVSLARYILKCRGIFTRYS